MARRKPALATLAAVLLLLIGSARNACAYVDPGSGALIWQTLVAAIIGCLFYFRSFARWLLKNGGRSKGKKE